MNSKYIVSEEPKRNHLYPLLSEITSYLDWEIKQKREIRGGQVMYDVKGTHKFLYMHELYEYWYNNIFNVD